MIAEANEARTTLNLMKMIEESARVWLWAGIALAVVVVIAFIVIFMRYGRSNTKGGQV
ncbi:MAG: hypothetical protein V1932_05725 [Chloroflexota bacterium]